MAAVRLRALVRVVSGSTRATSGTLALLTMAIFTLRGVSRMMANCETSAELPAVVGTQTSGGMGLGMASTPS